MSRIGNKIINIPEGVEIKIETGRIFIKGPKGELSKVIPEGIEIKEVDKQLIIKRESNDKNVRSLHGLIRALIVDDIIGVKDGYTKKLELVGVGFKAEKKGEGLVFSLGFSHPIEVPAVSGINLRVDKNIVIVEGIDKQLVGEFAAKIKALKPPEPYKGKGIRYVGEYIRRKPGKAGKVGTSTA